MKLSKKQRICFCGALLSLAVFGGLTAVSAHISHLHEAQNAAARWQAGGDVPYTQMSAFLTEDACMTQDGLQSIRESVDASMRSASLEKSAENARLWYDAYSAPAGMVTASGTKRYSAQAQVTAVGGDFFLLHAPLLLSGSYLQESDLMQDRVVLDETLAWHLFGSPDVEGMLVTIGQRTYPVAGVIAAEDDYASERAYGETARMYISFDLYEAWQAETGSEARISCYEMVLPEPVRNYGKNAFVQAIGAENNPTMKTVQNTGRSSLKTRWEHLRHLHDMVMVSDTLAYPYWENAARMVDFDLALLLAAQLLFLAYPVLTGLYLLWKGWKRLDTFLTAKRQAYKNRFRSLVKSEGSD